MGNQENMPAGAGAGAGAGTGASAGVGAGAIPGEWVEGRMEIMMSL